MRISNLRDSRYNVTVGITALLLGAVALWPLPLIQAAPESSDAEPFEPQRSSCLPPSLDDIGDSSARSPIAANAITPYEQHASFASWSQSYDDIVAKVNSLEKEINSKLETDAHRVDDTLENRYARATTHKRPASIIACEQVLAEETSYNNIIDEQITSSKEEEARRAAKVAPIADVIDTDGWSDDKIDFVIEWAGRIDAFLSGRPACGYGAHFAAAAYDYNVDPRVGPSIAVIESGAGQAMFRSYNMWGWGSSSWGSFEEAIDQWTASFSAGYGYDMDASDCARYCPGSGGYYGTLTSLMSQI